MKRILLFISIAMVAISCQKQGSDMERTTYEQTETPGIESIPAGYELPECVTATETPILAGQTTNVGSITVWNDVTNVYVSYQTTGDYRVKKTHLFVGACTAIPVNNAGNPRIGQYPFQVDHGSNGVSQYTYIINRSTLPAGCLCVSAHAEVIARNASGSIIFSQTGWGQGTQINDGGSWAMQFGYCQQDCDGGPR